MNIKRLTLLTFAAMSLATAALADGPGFLKSADLNKDGVIDQSEYQAARDNWFQDLDANKDGFISSDELKAAAAKLHAGMAKRHTDANGTQQDTAAGTPPTDTGRTDRFVTRMMTRLDTDKDGKISKAEFDADGAAFFKRLDKNADGKIASDEMPAGRMGGGFGPHMFDRMDTNKDGQVTKAEFTAAGEALFAKLDVNGDGVLTKDEMKMPKHHDGGVGPASTPGVVPPADQAPTP
jgi:Ca2+-binding EF-hand superfamily protein